MVAIVPNVTNWSVTPQNGQIGYFTLMNTWLFESTSVIASLNTAIAKINEAGEDINNIGGNAINAITFDNIAQLKLNSNIGRVDVLGYYTKGDGGGGTFYWDSISTESDNGGTIIQATAIATGRWKRVYTGAVNVKWFGAKGDGVTDDTAAIQNANNIGTTFIPDACFMVSSLNVINSIFGDGVLKQVALSNSIMIIISALEISIKNITLDQNNSNQTYGVGKFMVNSTQSNVLLKFENVKFKDFCEGAIRIIGDRTTTTRERLYLNNCLFIGGTESTSGVYNTFTIYAGDASEINIDGCDFNHGLNISLGGLPAITIAATTTTSPEYSDVIITNNKFNGYGRFTKIGGIGTIDCYIWAKNMVITGNRFTNSRVTPIRAKANAKNAIIANNIMSDFVDTGSANGTGISIISQTYSPTLGNYTISNNIIVGAMYRGIEVSDSTTLISNVLIDGNIIDTCNDIGIYIAKATRFNIINNTIKSTSQQGIAFASCEGLGKISNNSIQSCGGVGIGYVGSQPLLLLQVHSNFIDTSYGSGVTVENIDTLSLQDNIVKDVVNAGAGGQRGFRVGGSVGINNGQIKNNIALGTYATAQYSVIINGFLHTVHERGNSWNFNEQYSPSAPKSGTWTIGDVVWNTNPTSGGYIGWVCTTAGTPGTWKAFGLIL